MGACGSGEWIRWDSKDTTESQRQIDIRYLKKSGLLNPGTAGFLAWSRGGRLISYINYQMEKDQVILNYRYRFRGGPWEDVKQVINFNRTSCNYGGHRTWFLCPRCWKLVAILYGAGKYFLCRHCYHLTYSSQQENKVDRLMRKARKIRACLGAGNNLFEPILFKPKNMHQKTFDRLRREANLASNLSLILCGKRLGFRRS